jgi:protein TonB
VRLAIGAADAARPQSQPRVSFSRRQLAPALTPRGPVVSLSVHAGVVVLFLAASLLHFRAPATPDDPPKVDLVIGTSANVSGKPSPAAQPAPPSVAATAAPAPTPPVPTPQKPPTPAPQQARNLPPPSPQGSISAAEPTPPPQAQPAEASPAPPVARTAAPRAPSNFSVSLGAGFTAPAAQIEDAGIVQPAQADSGNVAPTYPVESSRRRERGTVLLEIEVGPDGAVRRVEVTQSSGFPALDDAARERLATWHFRPATRDGVPVGDIIPFEIHFGP